VKKGRGDWKVLKEIYLEKGVLTYGDDWQQFLGSVFICSIRIDDDFLLVFQVLLFVIKKEICLYGLCSAFLLVKRSLTQISALKMLWESVRRWSTSPPFSAGAARARPTAPSMNTGVIRGDENSSNM
jgi:hypothetical protein